MNYMSLGTTPEATTVVCPAAPRTRMQAGHVVACVAGVFLGLLLAVAVIPAAPAAAHASLQTSDPAAGAVLTEMPTQLTLIFTGPVQPVQDKIHVVAPDGIRVEQGTPVVSGATVTVALRSHTQGTYSVGYRVVSVDSHLVEGDFTYSVGMTSTAATFDDTQTGVDPVVRVMIPTVTFVGYAGLLLLVGPAMVLALLWPDRLSRRRPSIVAWSGLGLSVAATLAGIWLQAAYLTGSTLTEVGEAAVRDVVGSSFGALMLVRLGVLATSGVLLRPVLRDPGFSRTTLAPLVVLGVMAAATWPLTGHPVASPLPVISVVAATAHLAAMAVWLGGLLMLILVLLPRADEQDLGAILPIWSRWAATAVFVLVLTGIIQAVIEVEPIGALFTTPYGRLIIAKVSLLTAAVAVAAFARRLVHRGEAARRPAPLRRNVWMELGLTAIVLSLTTVLVQTPPARSAAAPPPVPQSTPDTTTFSNGTFALQVKVFPAQMGDNSFHLYAYTLDHKPLPIVEWKATAALPELNVDPIDIKLVRVTDNHAIGDVTLPTAGVWQLTFTLSTATIKQGTVTGTVTVR